jgi:uncharacterized membrane protein
VPKNRLEAFADGIFAIAATLLILNLAVTAGKPLGGELILIWPSYVAYVISFVTIGIMWVNHHTVMHQVAHVDRTFLMLTVLFLMLVAFVPFPTRLLSLYIRTDGALAAALAYGITLTLTSVMYNALWWYAVVGNRLLRHDADPALVRGIGRSFIVGPAIYLGATLVAFINPLVSAGLYLVIALFYVVESSIFGRRS